MEFLNFVLNIIVIYIEYFLFFDDGNIVVLFNGFQKKTTKTPDIEIERALKIKEEYYADKQSSASRL